MEKHIKFDNYNFNYYSRGSSTNFPILFLHGFIGNCREFHQSISLLSNDFYCLAVDLPGHGKTQVIGGEECYKMEHTAQGLIKFISALGIKRCILIGYSMGGRLALYLALYFPEYFSQVILESASPGLRTQAERDKRIQQDIKLAKELETEDFSGFITKWYNQPLFASLKNHPDFEKMLEHRLQSNPLELSKSLRNLSTGYQPSLWSKLQENVVPLLLLVGELDQKFISINTEMVSLCKFAQLEIVKNCGHNIHFENATLFVETIGRFLKVNHV